MEARGLAEIPSPKISAPKEARAPKHFEPGTIIRKGTLRDLPLPALVKVPIEKNTDGKYPGEWAPGEVEWVVTRLLNNGEAVCYRAGPETPNPRKRVACVSDRLWCAESKEFLYGATYLGPWEGKLDKHNKLNYKFRYRRPGSK